MKLGRAAIGVAGGLVLLATTACSGDFISGKEQSSRLVAAEAFGALTVTLEAANSVDFPRSANRPAAKAWVTATGRSMAATDSRFKTWVTATSQLSFVPAEGPGPDEQQIADFNRAYANWSASRNAFAKSINRCANSQRLAVSRRCMQRAVVSSADQRLAADTALRQQTQMISLSYVTLRKSNTSKSAS